MHSKLGRKEIIAEEYERQTLYYLCSASPENTFVIKNKHVKNQNPIFPRNIY